MMDVHERLHHARSAMEYSGDPLIKIGREIREESLVLCFDEFQVTDIVDAMILKRLFGAIWSSGGVVVATSNRHPTGLYEKGLNRSLFVPFIAELENKCEVWKLEGDKDYRMAFDEERQTVLYTNQEEFWEDLRLRRNGRIMQPIVIPVMMGRTLHVEAAGAGNDLLVHATFKSLCEADCGPSDYHALCKAARTIYLSGLRQFRADELDFARRFITLIDIAYENKTRVICSSEAKLFEIFGNIVSTSTNDKIRNAIEDISVRGEGGSSSSMMSTFIGETEWSATGLKSMSLASGGAGESDVKFAVGRAVSRLFEMGSKGYGIGD
jgi:protein AFG1